LQVDYAKLTVMLGLKSQASTRAAWCSVKRKLGLGGEGGRVTPKGKVTKPTSANSKKKTAKKEDQEGSGEDGDGANPSNEG
jgi:hypothetical protein